ncbi:MAG: hypothetical protein IJK45_08420 [Bacteroidaceae bacterium]|nr:hypothetical protein [Bacteroidaceae bacterium]
MKRYLQIIFFLAVELVLQSSVFNVQFSMIYAADKPAKPVKYKTLLGEAKSALKSSKNQAAAEKKLLDVVNREDITMNQRAEIYFTAQELERSQNDAENMKFYLKQSYDTVKYFSTILKMHEYLLLCDSIERLPNEKGVLKYKYRNKSREILKTYRTNLLNGGKFLLKRNKYAEAFPYFDMYIQSSQEPIFQYYTHIKNDTLLPRVAYWATVSAYNANDAKKALKHIDRAMEGSADTLRTSLQEYKVRCYDALGQKEERFKSLVEGTKSFPQHDYFYLNLMDEYSNNKSYDEGLALCDSMLTRVGDRAIYWYGKSQMYLGKLDYDSCIYVANEALRCDSLMTDAYYNKGIAYLNKAVVFAETACNDIRNPKCKKDREILMGLYREAKGPMETVRKLAPEDSKRWASPLYRIYLNLNMGKDFAEMEKILNAN